MNIENFKQVLTAIEANPDNWDQAGWFPGDNKFNDCKTACCIAGHAEILAKGKSSRDIRELTKNAMIYLEITPLEARWLFSARRTLDEFRGVAETSKVPS